MLLYAKTEEEISPDMDVVLSGNKISAKTSDLNRSFTDISARLKSIAKDYFNL